MADALVQSKKLQWKWVGITFALEVVFYLLPILFVGGVFGNYVISIKAGMFIGAWSFGGAILLPAIAAFLSEGITIWEPAIAGVVLVGLWYTAFRLFLARYIASGISEDIPYLGLIMVIIFLLSLLGAWYGERAQKLWRNKTPV
ncbi:MAG: hypothetical protein WBZ48_12295 [Bacteroidota bacterium]